MIGLKQLARPVGIGIKKYELIFYKKHKNSIERMNGSPGHCSGLEMQKILIGERRQQILAYIGDASLISDGKKFTKICTLQRKHYFLASLLICLLKKNHIPA